MLTCSACQFPCASRCEDPMNNLTFSVRSILSTAILTAVLCLAGRAAQAQTTFYTTQWYGINGSWTGFDSNWTIEAGVPYINGFLFDNGNGQRTRLAFTTAPGPDYSVQSALLCTLDGNNPYSGFALSHYLRDSAAGYYQVTFAGNTGPSGTNGSGTVTLTRSGAVLASAPSACGQTMTSTIVGAQITVSMGGTQLFSVTDATLATG